MAKFSAIFSNVQHAALPPQPPPAAVSAWQYYYPPSLFFNSDRTVSLLEERDDGGGTMCTSKSDRTALWMEGDVQIILPISRSHNIFFLLCRLYDFKHLNCIVASGSGRIPASGVTLPANARGNRNMLFLVPVCNSNSAIALSASATASAAKIMSEN